MPLCLRLVARCFLWRAYMARPQLVVAKWMSQVLPGIINLPILAAIGFLGALYWLASRVLA
jgi:hypothetical protein